MYETILNKRFFLKPLIFLSKKVIILQYVMHA